MTILTVLFRMGDYKLIWGSRTVKNIWFTAKDLFSVGGSGKDMEMIRVLKMFEHIGKFSDFKLLNLES